MSCTDVHVEIAFDCSVLWPFAQCRFLLDLCSGDEVISLPRV